MQQLLQWKRNKNYIPESMCLCVAFVIQQAKPMRRITLSSVACLAITCFSTLSKNGNIFGKNCVLILSIIFSSFFF